MNSIGLIAQTKALKQDKASHMHMYPIKVDGCCLSFLFENIVKPTKIVDIIEIIAKTA